MILFLIVVALVALMYIGLSVAYIMQYDELQSAYDALDKRQGVINRKHAEHKVAEAACAKLRSELYEARREIKTLDEQLSLERPDTVDAWKSALYGHVDLSIDTIGQCVCIPKYNVVAFERAIGVPEAKRVK